MHIIQKTKIYIKSGCKKCNIIRSHNTQKLMTRTSIEWHVPTLVEIQSPQMWPHPFPILSPTAIFHLHVVIMPNNLYFPEACFLFHTSA